MSATKQVSAYVERSGTLGLACSYATRSERLSIGLQGEKRWVIDILLAERSKSRVGVDCGDGARGRRGFDPSTFCG